jgi:hypothetical protein
MDPDAEASTGLSCRPVEVDDPLSRPRVDASHVLSGSSEGVGNLGHQLF